MNELKPFTCVGSSFGSPVLPATRKDWEAPRRASWMPDLCRRIEQSTDDEHCKTLKAKLPVWTPRCAAFRHNHRKESEALQPLPRLMLDIDEKGHTDEILSRLTEADGHRYIDTSCGRLQVLLVEESVRHGTHILVRMPEGLTPDEVQHLVGEHIGYPCDPAVKNVAGCIYQVPMDYTRYLDEAMFLPEEPVKAETPASVKTETQEEVKTETREARHLPDTYQGIPYSRLVQKYWELYNHGKEPCAGNRNVLTYEIAMTLRPICDYDQALLEHVIPRYDGFAETEWRKTIENALKEPRKGMPYRLRQVLQEARKDKQYAATGGTVSTPPPMPSKLPPSLRLFSSKVPKEYVAAVCEGVFPALGAHLHGVYFRYTDNVLHEATFMNVLMAPFSIGKSCIKKPIDYLMADIQARDLPSRQAEAEYKRKNPACKTKKDQRPAGICIQMVIDNLTDAVFNQRVADLERNGHRFMYTRVDEIEQLKKVTSKETTDEVGILIRKAWDNADHGQERVGSDSVTGIAPLRWNFNASCTIQNGRKFLQKACNDGTLSRLNISTIVKHDPNDDSMPVYGVYDDAFAEAIRPYIERLNTASGLVECPQATRLAQQITRSNSIRATLYESEAYRELSYRANVIAFLKGMVLYILEGCRWSKEIADYVRWSEQMDLWCKMRFFGQQLEKEIAEEKENLNDLPQNMLAMLPDMFTLDEYIALRQKLGKKGNGRNTLNQWVHRKLVAFDDIGNVWIKTSKKSSDY